MKPQDDDSIPLARVNVKLDQHTIEELELGRWPHAVPRVGETIQVIKGGPKFNVLRVNWGVSEMLVNGRPVYPLQLIEIDVEKL